MVRTSRRADHTRLPSVSSSQDDKRDGWQYARGILAQSDKSQEREGSALAVKKPASLINDSVGIYDSVGALVRQLRGPHLSTCP